MTKSPKRANRQVQGVPEKLSAVESGSSPDCLLKFMLAGAFEAASEAAACHPCKSAVACMCKACDIAARHPSFSLHQPLRDEVLLCTAAAS